MRPLSEDLRRRIIEARQAGAGSVEVSERFRVSRRTVARLQKQFASTGELRPKQIGGYRRARLAAHGRTIDRDQRPLAPAAAHGVEFKKKRRAPPSRIGLM